MRSFIGIGLKRSVREALDSVGCGTSTGIDSMCKYLVSSRSESTVRKYYSYFQKWKRFCSENGFTCMPAQPIHVAMYITRLMDSQSSFNVISACSYSIKWAHSLCGKLDPTNNGFVQNLLESAKRLRSRPVVKKDVVTSAMLIELCSLYENSSNSADIRDLCMILIGFSGFLRYDELSKLKCSNVKLYDSHFSIKIDSSKTDKYRKGDEILIAEGESIACPFKMLKRYIDLIGIDLSSDQFLFKPMFNSGGKCKLIYKNKPLSYTRAKECILAKLHKIDPNLNLGLHSLRAGGATAAANSKAINDRCWKRHGRWRTDTSKDGYVEDSFESRIGVTRVLGL